MIEYLKLFLKKSLKSGDLKKYFYNTSWMLGEKIFTMSFALVVSILVARYLGPENYGILSYAISLTSLFAVATHMGLSGLAVRELVKHPDKNHEILGTIFGIKFIGGIISLIAFFVLIITLDGASDTEFWVLLIVSGTILLKPFEIFDFWFQSKVKAKYSSIVRASATISISIMKIAFVILGTHLLTFAVAYLLQALILAMLFLIFFSFQSDVTINKWEFKIIRAKKLIGQSWMIMIGTLFAIIYIKIDQVMLRWLVSVEEVGIYSVAANLSEAWYFIPGVIVSSLFPKLLELKNKGSILYNLRLQQLFDLLFGVALTIAIIVTIFSKPVISYLYGVEFEGSAIILSIHIWAGIFIFMRAVFSKWILIEDAIAFSMITHGAGAIINILLNLYFIPFYAGIGAAIATILSYAMASYFSLLLYKKSRPIFWMMTKSFISPIRYLIKSENKHD